MITRSKIMEDMKESFKPSPNYAEDKSYVYEANLNFDTKIQFPKPCYDSVMNNLTTSMAASNFVETIYGDIVNELEVIKEELLISGASIESKPIERLTNIIETIYK